MTTYVPVPAYAERKAHPRALFLILGAHAAVLAAVMLAKMDLPARVRHTPITVEFIPDTKPPPPLPAAQPQPRHPIAASIDHPQVVVPTPQTDLPPLATTVTPPSVPDIAPLLVPNATQPQQPVRTAARFATPQSELKPPYPADKLRAQEEASLKLRLTIDEEGRVIAVDPVGTADPSFLAAARRHILRHWRYQPATEDGRAVASSTVITLTFKLDEQAY